MFRRRRDGVSARLPVSGAWWDAPDGNIEPINGVIGQPPPLASQDPFGGWPVFGPAGEGAGEPGFEYPSPAAAGGWAAPGVPGGHRAPNPPLGPVPPGAPGPAGSAVPSVPPPPPPLIGFSAAFGGPPTHPGAAPPESGPPSRESARAAAGDTQTEWIPLLTHEHQRFLLELEELESAAFAPSNEPQPDRSQLAESQQTRPQPDRPQPDRPRLDESRRAARESPAPASEQPTPPPTLPWDPGQLVRRGRAPRLRPSRPRESAVVVRTNRTPPGSTPTRTGRTTTAPRTDTRAPAAPAPRTERAPSAPPPAANSASAAAHRSSDTRSTGRPSSTPAGSGDRPNPVDEPDPREACALAGAFAADFLSWDESNPRRRGEVLRQYLAPGAGDDTALLGWSGKGRQRSEFALPGSVRPDGAGRVVVDVRVRVTPYRAVGIAAEPANEPADEMEVAGVPSSAPAPTARGWKSLDSCWVRLAVPVRSDRGRLVVDSWDGPLEAMQPSTATTEEAEPGSRPVITAPKPSDLAALVGAAAGTRRPTEQTGARTRSSAPARRTGGGAS